MKAPAQAATALKQIVIPARPVLQRQCACGNHAAVSGECAECRKKKNNLQPSLAVNRPHDVYEQEADSVAEKVIRMAGAAPPRSGPIASEKLVQRKTAGDPAVQTAPPAVDEVLKSSGHPLDAQTRAFMEPRFGHDLSMVRVHSDAAAARSARELNANAYTVGHHLVFASGRFAPGAPDGNRLLAHELTHVVQQGASRSSPGAARVQRQGGGPPAPEGQPGNRPNLDVGSEGPGVRLLQRLLGVPESGIFDETTRKAVVDFQQARPELHPATGGVGPKTWQTLDALHPVQAAAPEAAAPDAPPFFGMSPAPDALHGIHLEYNLNPGEVPHVDFTLFSQWIKRPPYSIKTYCRRNPDGSASIEYYNVVRTEPGSLGPTNWSEYFVGPDSIQEFLGGLAKYDAGGKIGYMFGRPAPNAIESAKFVEHVFAGEGGEAAKAYGRALYESVKDPGWWVQILTGVAGMGRVPDVPGAPRPPVAAPRTPVPSEPFRPVIVSRGPGVSSRVVGRVSYASVGGVALAEPVPEAAPAPARPPLALAPSPAAAPAPAAAPLVLPPPGAPFIPVDVAARAQAAIAAGALNANRRSSPEAAPDGDPEVDVDEVPETEVRNCPKGLGPVDCKPLPIARKGGDSKYTRRHNRCADKVTTGPNRAKDICVKGKAFDGLDANNVLWEIKGHAYSYANIYKDKAMALRIVKDLIKEFLEQAKIAAACGYGFKIGVRDAGLKDAILAVNPNLDVEVVKC